MNYLICKKSLVLILIISISFAIRLTNIGFPTFTSDEAAIAYRGYTLSNFGQDELGRNFPVIFNSSQDYQLPGVSYITALGVLIFGKNDFGVRVAFMFFGVGTVVLAYMIAKQFSKNQLHWALSALILSFSPPLIFLSKVPNETIILVFLFSLLFYLLTRPSINTPLLFFTIFAAFVVSKNSWLILPGFVAITLLYIKPRLLSFEKKFIPKKELALIVFSFLGAMVSLLLFFLLIPQAMRSLSENNFQIFSSPTLGNGIDRLRGQGIQAGWPALADKVLFNKLHFFITGLLHWFDNLSLGNFFGRFDDKGLVSFTKMAAWSRVLIIPFLLGIYFAIKNKEQKERYFLIFFPALTIPSVFVFPEKSQNLLVLTLPFMVPFIVLGFFKLRFKLAALVFLFMTVEVLVNIFWIAPEINAAGKIRPWEIEEMITDAYLGQPASVYVSDDITQNIYPFIVWFNNFREDNKYSHQNDAPYKMVVTRTVGLKVIITEDQLSQCEKGERVRALLSERDVKKTGNSKLNTIKSYPDTKSNKKIFLVEDNLCLN